MRGIRLIAALAIVASWHAGARADGSVRHLLRTTPTAVGVPDVAIRHYANAADATLENGVRNLPIFPASSPSYTYRYDPDCGCFTLVPVTMGPWFLVERGHTLGKGLINFSLTWGEYDLGHSCDEILRISAGRVASRTGIERLYNVATLGIDYGVTNDLDVSAEIPVATLDFGVNYHAVGGTAGGVVSSQHHDILPPHLMDTMLRAKYRVLAIGPWTVAAGAQARLPTGDVADGFGTGDGEVGPFGALEGSFFEGVLGSYLDAGFDADVSNSRRSSAHWGAAVGVQPPDGNRFHDIMLTGQVLGRHEIADGWSRDSLSGPHAGGNCPYLCFDPGRHDYFDAVLGIRARLVRSLVVSAGVFKAINEDTGVRAQGWSPVVSLEATF